MSETVMLFMYARLQVISGLIYMWLSKNQSHYRHEACVRNTQTSK